MFRLMFTMRHYIDFDTFPKRTKIGGIVRFWNFVQNIYKNETKTETIESNTLEMLHSDELNVML